MYKYEMSTEMTYKNLLTTMVAPLVVNARGEALIEFSTTSQEDRAEEIYQKLLSDNSISIAKYSSDTISVAKGSFAPDKHLNCGATTVHVYRISKDKVTFIVCSVKSDGSTFIVRQIGRVKIYMIYAVVMISTFS